jgi:serine/threonine protein kinase
MESGKTIGEGGFGKCKVKFSHKYNRKVVEKKLNFRNCFRSTLFKNDPILQFLKIGIEINNKIDFDNKHQVLRNEAKMLKKLKFIKLKYCVEIIDYIDNPPTIIMEFCEGGDLRKIIDKNESIPVKDRIEIIIQILKGLKALHKVGIIHGDLKAMNIFLSKEYVKNKINENIVKLGDFGLSDQKKILGGTPGFMAPEIRTTGGSFASDIYSIGKVMLEVITCLPLETICKINSSNIQDYYLNIPKFFGSNEFILLVKQCLNEDPKKRPSAIKLNDNFWQNVLVRYDNKYKEILLKKKRTRRTKKKYYK